MEITPTTPALLFAAISLLLLAYTNRFLALASLIRDLHRRYHDTACDAIILEQISNLRRRVVLIRSMQTLGIASLLLCVLCMFVLFAGQQLAGKSLFAISLVLMMSSLGVSLREIHISVGALDLELSDIESSPNSGLTRPEYRG
jgi:hypothetical protein